MLNSNTVLKILSIVIAVALWAYVIEVTNPTKTVTINDVPVQLLNEDSLTSKGLAMSGEANYTVDIVVEGRRADLANLDKAKIIANADLFGYSIGKNTIPVTMTAPEGLSILQSNPSKINVVVEELVEVTRPIRVNFVGELEAGVEAGQISTQPEAIRVSGAKSEVAAVAYIEADVSTARLSEQASSVQTNAVAVNRSGDLVQNVRLSSSFITVTARLSRVKEVLLNVVVTGEVAPIYEVTHLDIPSTVKIKGAGEDFAGIEALTAAAIDISEVTNTSRIPLRIELPSGVEFASGYENMAAEITIKPVATTEFTFTSDEILIEGVEGADIVITTPEIMVIVSGSEEVIAELKKEDLQAYLTLDAESLITATAQVQIRSEKTLGHISVDPAEVHITLGETE